MKYSLKMTTRGRAVLAGCMAKAVPLELTRTAVGNGRVPDGTDLADVHALFGYVDEATIAERRHEDDRLFLNVQYTNAATPKAFMLAEFMIYATDPDTGKETDFIYATLGDYAESIPAHSPAYPMGIWNHRLIVVVSDEVNVSISAATGIVTHDELSAALSRQAGVETADLTIPTTGWTASGKADFPYTVSIPVKAAREFHIPRVNLDPDNLAIAAGFGLCSASYALDGAVRLWAKKVPTAKMTASVTLVRPGGQLGNITSPLPVATAHSVGGIKGSDSIRIDADGTAHAILGAGNFATQAEVDAALNDVFGSQP